MAVHRKFTFENPEDSYWNSSDFIEIPFDNSSTTNAAAARAALDDLFECKFRFDSDDGWSNTGSESPSAGENSSKQEIRNGTVDVLKTVADSSLPSRTFIQYNQ
ncbi:unnamed protein product, partial [Litomosoides sigmodontis]